MNKKLLVITFIFVFYLFNLFNVIFHEEAHVQIYNQFDCNNITITYDAKQLYLDAETKATCPKSTIIITRELTAKNEILNYHLVLLFNLMIFLSFLYFLFNPEK